MPVPPPLSVAVVGGGIAGLAAAHEIARQRPDVGVTVLEGSASVGGKLRVSQVGGLSVDEGAEAMLNRRPEAVALAREVGLGDDLVHPATTATAVWTRGAVRPLPPTLLGVPTDLSALARSGLVNPAGLVRMLADYVLPRSLPRGWAETADEDVAVGDLVAGRLGPQVRDRLVEPLLGGIYAGDSTKLSLRAAAAQIAAVAGRHRSLLAGARAARARAGAGTEVPVFAGIRGGVGRLPAAVAASSGADVRTGATVRALEHHGSGWRLVVGPTPTEEAVDVDAVVLAVPAAPARRLLAAVAPPAAVLVAEIEYASVVVVTAVFTRAAVHGRLTGSGFLVPPKDGRAIKAATYVSNKWAWPAEAEPDLVAVRASLGRHREQRVLQRDDADLAALALTDLAAATGVTAAPVGVRVTRWGGSLPQYVVGHQARVSGIRTALADVPGLAVCGAAYDGVGVAACVASGQRAAAQVLLGLPARSTMKP